MPLKSLLRKSKEERTSSKLQEPSRDGSPALSVPLPYGYLPLRPSPETSTSQITRPTVSIGAPSRGTQRLPAGWTAERDGRYGEWYYVNIYTEKSQWEKPTGPVYPPAPPSKSNILWHTEPTGPQTGLPEGWKAEWDGRYKEWFFVNVYTKRSQWDKPTRPVYAPHERRDHNSHVVQFWQGGRYLCPDWYMLEQVAELPREDLDYLCATCRHINLSYLFSESEPARTAPPEDYIRLGPFREMAEEPTCRLCRIVTATIRERIKLSTRDEGVKLETDVERLLTAEWYLSPFVYEHESKPVTNILHLQHSIFDEEPKEDTPFALRRVFDGERGGRRIPDDVLDFSWIKETIERCDINTEFPPKDFEFPLLMVGNHLQSHS